MKQESVQHLYQLLVAGKPVEAMELYYHEDVIMQENETEPRIGKTFCIQHETKLMQAVQNFKARILAQAINEIEGIVFTQMEISFSRNGKQNILNEVSVQKWQDNKVKSEKFYYTAIKIE